MVTFLEPAQKSYSLGLEELIDGEDCPFHPMWAPLSLNLMIQ